MDDEEKAGKSQRRAICLRMLLLLLTAGVVVLSVMGTLSCEFITKDNKNTTIGLFYWSGVNLGSSASNSFEAANNMTTGATNSTNATDTTGGAGNTTPGGSGDGSGIETGNNIISQEAQKFIPSFIESETCVAWKTSAMSEPFLYGARAMTILGIVTGGLAFIHIFVETFFCGFCCSTFLKTLWFSFATAGIGLSFLVFGSNYCKVGSGCSLGKGSIYMITALILAVIVDYMLCTNPKPDPMAQAMCCNKKKDDVDPSEQQPMTELPRVDQDPDPDL